MTQVTNSIFEVMETMFYRTLDEMPDIDPDNPPGDPGRFKTAAVTFSGEFSGTIFISIPDGLLRTMTADFLGQDMAGLTPDHVDGTLKEALNMVAGSTLTRVNETTYMGLGIPQIVATPVSADVDEAAVLNAVDDLIIARVKLD
ncbi:MAG: chemotaxis protein CheX [Desulfobacter sp.]|nr:MAG: chemotaxis protein CheX [Desulfobacter sp.]